MFLKVLLHFLYFMMVLYSSSSCLRLVPLSRSGFTHCSSTIVGVKSTIAPFIILPLVLDTFSWQLVAAEITCLVPFATSLRVSYRWEFSFACLNLRIFPPEMLRVLILLQTQSAFRWHIQIQHIPMLHQKAMTCYKLNDQPLLRSANYQHLVDNASEDLADQGFNDFFISFKSLGRVRANYVQAPSKSNLASTPSKTPKIRTSLDVLASL